MKHLLFRNLLFAGPALLVFAVLLPTVATALDRWLGISCPLHGWAWLLGAILISAGLTLAALTLWLFATVGQGTPNPLAPPRQLVLEGPYRFSRNPMMLGGWIAGLGLALMLGSPSLAAALAVIVVAGSSYVRWIEEPRLTERFGAEYEEYAARVPRWFGCPIRRTCAISHHA